MVRARLHLICGNCGCNDEWEWEYRPKEVDEGEAINEAEVWIWCRNCSTLHTLSDNAKRKAT